MDTHIPASTLHTCISSCNLVTKSSF